MFVLRCVQSQRCSPRMICVRCRDCTVRGIVVAHLLTFTTNLLCTALSLSQGFYIPLEGEGTTLARFVEWDATVSRTEVGTTTQWKCTIVQMQACDSTAYVIGSDALTTHTNNHATFTKPCCTIFGRAPSTNFAPRVVACITIRETKCVDHTFVVHIHSGYARSVCACAFCRRCPSLPSMVTAVLALFAQQGRGTKTAGARDPASLTVWACALAAHHVGKGYVRLVVCAKTTTIAKWFSLSVLGSTVQAARIPTTLSVSRTICHVGHRVMALPLGTSTTTCWCICTRRTCDTHRICHWHCKILSRKFGNRSSKHESVH